ncbi:peptidoglycan D,D-transpeptidase FtsI family protein [Microlunatus soli]|uniref:Cell division protein FtsI (Penicillin-binding protein 3) n=1 Tax=Microlunatus soli TaxID=630515 RepID=A0A1H1PGB9_9ACTN|nr:penicillin-binding protein 2 [Microlunatus soli]SDS10065.1 cell division protein FtsI (penicillin-binding protein 3) [Microlunatus soli]
MGERRQHPSQRGKQNPKKAATGATKRTAGGRTLRNGQSAGSAKSGARKQTARATTARSGAAARPKIKTGTGRTRSGKINSVAGKINSGRPRKKRALRIPLGSAARRVRVIGIVMAIAISLCAGRLLQLQGFDSAAYGAIASANLTTKTPLLPARGEITGRDGTVLAGTEPAVDITADPTLTSQDCAGNYVGKLCGLNEATKIAQIIGAHTKIDMKKTIRTLTTTKQPDGDPLRFAYVVKKVPADVYSDIANELDAQNLPGIYRESNPIRTYPSGSIASNIVGFVNSENKGQAGIEWSMNRELAGVEGSEQYESAPNGSKIPLGESTVTPAKNGTNYQLTIDPSLQWVAQRRLDAQVAKTGAKSGMLISIDVKTGQLLAAAQSPGYDSNAPGAASADDLGNRPVSQAYEPGSVEKVLTAAALLDSGTATPETRVTVPPTIASGGGRIKDAEPHGTVNYTMRGIIANSSNIGTLMLARQMDKKTLHDYLSSFGLGKTTGVGLPGEATGTLPGADMKDYTRDQIAFGQGLSVTAVQEAAAIAGIINGGVYHAPSVIESASNADGTPVDVDHPAGKRIISEKSSAQIRDMMEAVVTRNEISQQLLMLDGYRSGGKTGTAQRYDPDCGCYNGYVTSFVGFAPLDDPRILTYVVFDKPKRGDSGTGTAGPVYTDVMDYALPRYGVKPDMKSKKWGAAQMDRPLTW